MVCFLTCGLAHAQDFTFHLAASTNPSILSSSAAALPPAQRGPVDLSIVPQLKLRDARPSGETMPIDVRAWMKTGVQFASRPMTADAELSLAPARLSPCADLPGSTGRKQACAAGPVAETPRKGLHEQLWFVTIEVFAVQTASIAIFAALPGDVSGFVQHDFRNIAKFAKMGPHFDDDRWGFNFIGHPLAGSEYHLIARNRGAGFFEGMLYAAAWSGFWEFVTEGMYERASIQDLIVTPVAGAVLGELRHQIRRAILRANPEKAKKFPLNLAVLALDPIQAITEAAPLRIGGSSSP